MGKVEWRKKSGNGLEQDGFKEWIGAEWI